MGFENITPEKPRLPNLRLEGTKDPSLEGRFQGYHEDRLYYQNSPYLREIKELEQEPTPEEAETIKLVDYWTNALLKKYGVAPINVPPQAVHVLSRDNLPRGWKADVEGQFYGESFGIAIVRQSGQYPFAHINFHEMLHAKSRRSARFIDKNNKPQPKRFGLGIVGKEPVDGSVAPEYFRWMDEAVTEELTKKFIQTCIKVGKWRTEYDSTRDILSRPELPEYIRSNASEIFFASKQPRSWADRLKRRATDKNTNYEFRGYGYAEERTALNMLLSTLYEKNRDQFQSREQVFDVFARAMLDGTLLPLGRLIERTFGKGLFKKVGSVGSVDELHSLIWATRHH